MLQTLRAVKELIQASKSGDEQKVSEWKDKYSDREKEKGVFRF